MSWFQTFCSNILQKFLHLLNVNNWAILWAIDLKFCMELSIDYPKRFTKKCNIIQKLWVWRHLPQLSFYWNSLNTILFQLLIPYWAVDSHSSNRGIVLLSTNKSIMLVMASQDSNFAKIAKDISGSLDFK